MRTLGALACAFAVLLLGGVSATAKSLEPGDPSTCYMPGYGFELAAPEGMEVTWQELDYMLLDPAKNYNSQLICWLKSGDRKGEVAVRIARLSGGGRRSGPITGYAGRESGSFVSR